MMEYLQALTWQQLSAGGVIIVILVVMYRDKLKGLVPRRAAEDTDVEDLAACKRLQDRGERRGCKEFQGAVETCFLHFFDGADDE